MDTAKSVRLVALAGLLCAQLVALRGHDIYSSFAEATLLPGKLELTLTLARSSAHDLLADARTLPPITLENFADFTAPLRAIASELLAISAGETPLRLRSVEVRISGDNDVTFTLAYPPPTAGPLRFGLHYLRHLVDGHVATLVVTNAAGDDLGWSPLTVDQPRFQTPFPQAKPATKR